ncbi:hypothetical protein F5876DRAFT_68860 [Lentinula aff. lateritia]|uniref:Uncharacterized protein n=1 Tax=Lentinula aff. lateritia TaxID=2804960 RepID=A0ACC1TPC1_9AGAR|nr:hypothetical protein F5876DRAFT_68860 [Lentinula aff. lateritia]
MRLDFAYLTTIALVSFAYAAPVVRRKHGPFPVNNVTVVYDPNDVELVVGESDREACMIEAIKKYMKEVMSSTFQQAPEDSFHFEKTASEDKKMKGTAEFSVEVVEEEEKGKAAKTRTYQGGELIYNAFPVTVFKHPH